MICVFIPFPISNNLICKKLFVSISIKTLDILKKNEIQKQIESIGEKQVCYDKKKR